MNVKLSSVLLSGARILSLLLCALIGTVLLVRFAPGYFSDAGELDAQHASTTRAVLDAERSEQGSLASILGVLGRGWIHGDMGRSRQLGVPVAELVFPRARTTGKLLLSGILGGWLISTALAFPLSARRDGSYEPAIAVPSAVLLAVPIGAVAMACMVSGLGGPVLVLTGLVAVRDFRFLYRLLRQSWTAPHLLHARAQGVLRHRVAFHHLLPSLRRELLSLAMMSVVLALGAVVPIEVIFDLPGLGQLAWSAAMNRDLPVLLSVTMIMAVAVGIAGLMTGSQQRMETTSCA